MFKNLKEKGKQLAINTRNQALNAILSDEATFIEAERQARVAGCNYDIDFANSIKADFNQLKNDINSAQMDAMDGLVERSRDLKRLRAYVLPAHEIEIQGKSVFAELNEWSVPSSVLNTLKDDILPTLNNKDIYQARTALYNVFDNSDYWSGYIDWFAQFMRYVAGILMFLMLSCLIGSFFFLLNGKGATKGFILAGASGALVSIISKLPPIIPYGETAGYIVRILSRTSTGIAACVIGFGFLASGTLSSALPDSLKIAEMIDRISTKDSGDLGRSFKGSDSVSSPKTDTNLKSVASIENSSSKSSSKTRDAIILVALAMLFGFSERALVSFEDKIFPVAEAPTKALK
jgi:hypothetical protein